MKVSVFTTAIADELNDLEPGHEYDRWPLPKLYNYIQQALQQIKLLEPSLFTVLKTITLREGEAQFLEAEDGELLDIPTMVPADYELLQYFKKPNYCFDPYVPKSYKINPSNSRLWYVFPPVPGGALITVDAVVSKKIPIIVAQDQDIQLPGGDIDKYFNPILDWSLYRAFSKDTESQENLALADKHYKAFYDAFGAVGKMDDKRAAQRMAKGENAQ